MGSGQDGRVTKADILNYLPNRNKPTSVTTKSENSTTSSLNSSQNNFTINRPAVSVGAEDEVIEMDRMRKIIAENMVMSKHVAPHVTSYVEADVTNLVLWRDKAKKEFEKRDGEKLTFTPIFIEAVAKAIKDFPMINVSVDNSGTKIIIRKNINIGMAAALPSGNLIVPVIKNADQKNLLGITKAVNDLANRARKNKLLPDEIQGGTFTLTNVGSFGNLMGTPIILQPQVAILAVGSIKKKPAVIETPQGDTIGVRQFMYLSLSYDHRVVDGSLGGSFLRRVADYLVNEYLMTNKNLDYYSKNILKNAREMSFQSLEAYNNKEINYIEYLSIISKSFQIERNYLNLILENNQTVLKLEYLLNK